MGSQKVPFQAVTVKSVTRVKGTMTVVAFFPQGTGGRGKLKTFTIPDSGNATDENGVILSGATLTTLQTTMGTLDTNIAAFINAMDTAHKFDV
jgi:ribosome-binding ATPase YchF (GTP1/OBG family)